MKTTSLRARTLACALLAGTAYGGLAARPAAAQTAREHRALDSNGVDLTWGDYLMRFTEGSIGSGEAELALVRTGVFTPAASNGHEWDGVILIHNSASGPVNNDVYLGTTLVPFHNSDTSPDGSATLTGSGSSYVYRSADGTEISFGDPTGNSEPGSNLCNGSEGQTNCSLLPMAIASPDGKTVTIAWDTSSYCPFNGSCTYYTRIAGLSNSFGYRIAFSHAGGLGGNGIPTSGWFQRTGAAFYNDAVSTTIVQASTSYSYPATGVTQVTDPGGRVWRFSGTANGVTAIRRPGATSDTTGIAYSSGSSVSSVTSEGVTTSYSRSVSGGIATMTVTNALSQVSTVVSDLTIGRPTSITDPLSHTTSFTYDTSGRPKRTTAHEGNYVETTYDSRGNVTQTEAVPKGGTGARIVTAADYSDSCVNPVTCNQPDSVTDARGNVTDYTYDSTHGGVLTVTGPAVNGVRPQTRYSYTLTNGEYRLTGISQCQTGSSCAGTADEAKSTLAYDSSGNVTSASSGDGSGALTATSAMTYDPLGNLLTVDGPLTGTADTSRIRYDSARQVIGTISPDPDGVGALRHRAVRSTYTNGLLTRVETGNVNSQSDSDWAAFSPAQATETDYDANARPVKQKLVAGGTIYALTQIGYDSLGRTECAAQRMNPAIFATIATAACSLGTQGSGANDFGPDRIVKTIYDAAGRVTKVKTALGVTGEEADEVTATYTANGQVETVADAEDNETTFEYDDLDRLAKTRFPDATKGAGTSSTSDYEQPTYESLASGTRTSGLVVAFRNRAGESIGLGYDALGRLTAKDLPGAEPDATYGYDLLGRMLSATQNGVTASFTWDALGRQLTQAIPIASVTTPTFTSEYDLGGRRTKLTWPVDASSSTAYYANYDYLVTGEVEKVRERGATSGAGVLATYGYDDLGRRTSIARGNGATTGYGYDAVSRLSSMSHDFTGTTHDLTLGFSYNPASQIVSATRSNDLYAWNGHGNGTTSSTADGKNRLSSHAGATPTYDARGNLTFDGTYSYTYSSENLLTSGANSGPLGYDPLMRFYQSGPTYFIHDGVTGELIGDYYNGSIVGRHVPGAAADEPVGYVDKFGTRVFYHADERGSVIAGSNGSGANARIVLYDEYGKRGSGGSYRFAYTGQVHLLNDVYDYKSRNYYARLGRFGQTDRIGYGAGTNLYVYAGGDPVNRTDPLGLGPHDLVCNGGPCNDIVISPDDGGGAAPGSMGFQSLAMGLPARFHDIGLIEAGDESGGNSDDKSEDKTIFCSGPATTRGVVGNQATGDGALFSKYPQVSGGSIRGGTFGTVAVQKGFLGLTTRQLRMYGTQIGVVFSDQARSALFGGPFGVLTVSDYGDPNIQVTPGVAFDIYRFPTEAAGNKYGLQHPTAIIFFRASTGGKCPPGYKVQ